MLKALDLSSNGCVVPVGSIPTPGIFLVSIKIKISKCFVLKTERKGQG